MMWKWLKARLEDLYEPKRELGFVSRSKQYDINAKARQNVWYDKKGQKWPLRDSL